MTQQLSLVEDLLDRDPAEAAVRLGGVLAETPQDVRALCLLARAQLALGRPDLALTTAAGAVTVAPAGGCAQHVLSEVLTRLDRHDEAVVAAQRAVRLDPYKPNHHDRLARALLASGVVSAGLAEAELAARTAIELDSGSAPFHVTYALVVAGRGDLAAARRALLDALLLDPDHPTARRELLSLGSEPRRGWPIGVRYLIAGATAAALLLSIGAPAAARAWLLVAAAFGTIAIRAGLRR